MFFTQCKITQFGVFFFCKFLVNAFKTGFNYHSIKNKSKPNWCNAIFVIFFIGLWSIACYSRVLIQVHTSSLFFEVSCFHLMSFFVSYDILTMDLPIKAVNIFSQFFNILSTFKFTDIVSLYFFFVSRFYFLHYYLQPYLKQFFKKYFNNNNDGINKIDSIFVWKNLCG